MPSIVKMPATSSRKPNFADVKVVVIEDSPAHKVTLNGNCGGSNGL